MLLKDILYKKRNSFDIAIVYNDCYMTYNEFFNKVEDKAKHLEKIGYKTNQIGIFLSNTIDYIIAYFAITFIDNIIVPISATSRESELISIIEYCDLSLIITNNHYKEDLKCVLKNYTREIFIFSLDDNSIEKAGLGRDYFEQGGFSDTATENSVAIMLHTSGTTSNPKRVMLTHNNLISNIKSISQMLNLDENSRTILTVPLHLASGNSQMLTHLYVGASIVIMDGMFISNKILAKIQKHKITNFFGVPFMMEALICCKNIEKYDLSSVKFMCFGGGPVFADKITDFIKRFPQTGFGQMYGQTEASPRITHFLPDDDIGKIGSAGKPLPGIEVRLVDSKGRDVEIGNVGELIASGDNIMKGYYKNSAETEKVIKDGWLYTGDLARYDKDGYIYIIGRTKNIIIYSGYNIYPEEIEEVLMSHPNVKEAYVFGVEEEFSGEVPIAKVVLKDITSNITPDELINYCFDKMESYKVPDKIIFADQIEKTLSGKIKRYMGQY